MLQPVMATDPQTPPMQNRREDALPGLLRVPGWERFPWLCAGFSTRQGGRSIAYGVGELNLGWTQEDEAACVAANRQAFAAEVSGGRTVALTTVSQVHGTCVRDLDREKPPFNTQEGKALLTGDGLISRSPGRLLSILTADCVPVLVADTRCRAVGAFHAGWRGTLGHIVTTGIRQMRAHYGSHPVDLVAAIGPCIGACCFEVGDEVRSAFALQWTEADDLFTGSTGDGQTLRMDLVEANRRELVSAGVPAKSVSVMGRCTACARTVDGRRAFFSYRAEKGRTGRMLSAVGVFASGAA